MCWPLKPIQVRRDPPTAGALFSDLGVGPLFPPRSLLLSRRLLLSWLLWPLAPPGLWGSVAVDQHVQFLLGYHAALPLKSAPPDWAGRLAAGRLPAIAPDSVPSIQTGIAAGARYE